MREVPFPPKPREFFSQGFVSVPTKVFHGLPEVYVSFFFGVGRGVNCNSTSSLGAFKMMRIRSTC